MYNINLLKNEQVIAVFDDTFIKQGKNQKLTTIAITNQRLLFLDYFNETSIEETLRIAKGIDYLRQKEIYYKIELKDITEVLEDDYYYIKLKDNTIIEFDEEELYNLIKEQIK
jgi:hypothetical protein